MRVVTSAEMGLIDRRTIEEYGVPAAVLMERAGMSVADKVAELYGKRKVIVLAGPGNNGGDGIVCGRELFNRGWHVKVLLLAREPKMSPDCLSQYRIAKKMGVPVEFRTELFGSDLHSAVVVDAIFGTGLSKPLKPPVSDLIAMLNRTDTPVVAVDIPSGISSDTGQVMGDALEADVTVTFGLPKRGHLLHPGREMSGRVFVEDIGFPGRLLTAGDLKVSTMERTEMALLVPERPLYSHKGDYGHILVIAGSKGKTGAAMMAARACLRAGAGMVTLGVPGTLADVFQSRALEEMVHPLPDTGSGALAARAGDEILDLAHERIDAIAIGPGLGSSAETVKIMAALLRGSPVPMVVDADGLNALQGKPQVLKTSRSPIVITPHAGEMARLIGKGEARGDLVQGIERDRLNTAISFASRSGAYTVLKGAPTVVAEPEGRCFINTTGNPGMATAGAGDVLTGCIAAFLGQGLSPLDASLLGVYMHGLSGDIASSRKGMHSVIASDLIESMAEAFRSLETDEEADIP